MDAINEKKLDVLENQQIQSTNITSVYLHY